jgi:two-component system NtrC family sensor kinase
MTVDQPRIQAAVPEPVGEGLPPMSAQKPGRRAGATASPLAREVAALRSRVTDLEAARAEAQQRESAMRLTMAGLGHELNGPLSVLVSRIDLMRLEAQERVLPLPVLDDLTVLQRHVERLARVVRVVLALAASGHPERALVDMNAVLRETLTLVTKPMEQCGIRVHLALDEALPPVPGDPVALGQVAMNLLFNARDAMPAGGAVWVETGPTDGQPPGVRLVVRDAGPGIPDTIRATLWEPFHTTKPGGAGLGLWITRAIVENHDGTIELGSQTGEGTTWVIRLPGRDGPSAGS